MKRLQFVCATIGTACLCGPIFAQSPSMPMPQAAPQSTRAESGVSAPTSADDVMLSPGDMVRITVWRKPEMSGEFAVTSDGYIAHPLYREVRVGNISIAAAEQQLRAFLARYEQNPQFVIEPLLRVSVSGEVRQPNLFSLRPETTVGQVVALAGGPTERGRSDRVLLRRRGQEIRVELRSPTSSGALMPIRSGDQITVERERAVFREFVAPIIGLLGATAAVVSVILIYGDNNNN